MNTTPPDHASSFQPDGHEPGRILGDYRLIREIGRGGMGTVYEAEQVSLGRRVALKILPRALSMSEDALARFQREAHSAARLQIPGVVRVYGVGSDGDSHYLAMELVRGAPCCPPRHSAVSCASSRHSCCMRAG